MPAPASLALILLTCLLLKHAVADYGIQTKYMFLNKGRYGHPGGLLHAGFHVILTAPVLLLLPPPTYLAFALILVAEFIIHYHIDWMKERINSRTALQPDNVRYWHLHGLDQLLHGLTYIAIVAVLFLLQAP